MNNVKVSVFTTEFNTTARRNMVKTTPEVENVPAYLADTQTTLESEIINAKEGDRIVRYRLIFQWRKELENVLRSGAVIQVTHRLHRATNAWTAVSPVEQYVVQSDTDVQLMGMDINLGLLRKDQS